MEENLKVTCLHDSHVALGAKMSPFAGFDMPIQYAGITQEHLAVRQNVGMFDVSHMGEIFVSGPDAEAFVNHIFTNQVAGMEPGKILYGMMCYPDGGVVDDLLVYREAAENHYLLVVNAANIDKDYAWMLEQKAGFDVKVDNQSDAWGQIAVQGPKAEETLVKLGFPKAADLTFYTYYREGDLIVSRTGYTGEDGFEVYSGIAETKALWQKLLDAGVEPCGLGCRDTLRFEAGLPLYGDELSAEISPVEAGLGMFCTACRLSRGTGRRYGSGRGHHRLSFHLAGQEHLLCPGEDGSQRAGHAAVDPHPQESLPRKGGQEAFLSNEL